MFPEGLIFLDGRIQSGDQIIEVDGKDMTSTTHHDICDELRKPLSVLRLGIYRERIEAYRAVSPSNTIPPITEPFTGSMFILQFYIIFFKFVIFYF